jgi:hypothetical protein
MKIEIKKHASGEYFEVFERMACANGNAALHGTKPTMAEAVAYAVQLLESMGYKQEHIIVTYVDEEAVVEADLVNMLRGRLEDALSNPDLFSANPVSREAMAEQVRSSIEQFLSGIPHGPIKHDFGVRVAEILDDQTMNIEFTLPAHMVQDMQLREAQLRHMREDTFMGYFDDHIEYPHGVAFNPLPINTCWDYVSHTLLNGFLNYVTVIDAHLLDRYRPMTEELSKSDLSSVSYQEPPGSFKWKNFEKAVTKQELFDLLTQEGRTCHTKLSVFRDDVLILATCDNDDGQTMYMYFWFDQDVSDCCVGRFVTKDSQDVVVEKFRKWIDGLEYGRHQLPQHFFQGWLSF